MRALPRDRRGPARRRDRNGCRVAYRGGQDARAARRRALPPGLGAIQDLYYRRSPYALRAFVQCSVEDARRTAGRRQIHLRDDRDPQGTADRTVALPTLLAAARAGGTAHRTLSPDRRSRTCYGLARGARTDRTRRRWLRARRSVAARSGDCPFG